MWFYCVCRSIKWYATLHCLLTRTAGDGLVQSTSTSYRSNPQVLSDISEVSFDEICDDLNTQLEHFNALGSGWSLQEIQNLTISCGNFRPLAPTRGAWQRGSSYIPTPTELVRKQAIINVQNNGNRCFMYAVLSALHPADKHSERVSKYTGFIESYNWTNISFPTPLKEIRVFERHSEDIRTNVYVFQEKQLLPCT